MDVLRENMKSLLHFALKKRAEFESQPCFFPGFKSGERAAWEAYLKAVENGEQLNIKD